MYSISLNTQVSTHHNWIHKTVANFKMAIFFFLLDTHGRLPITYIFVSLQSNRYTLPE